MPYTDTFLPTLSALAPRWGEPVLAALLVHPAERRRRGLARTNVLALTPHHVRLVALGGRTGLRPKDDLGCWPRDQVAITVAEAERSSWFASTGSSYDFPVRVLHVTAPGTELDLDVVAPHADDVEVLGDEPVRELDEELARLLTGVTRA